MTPHICDELGVCNARPGCTCTTCSARHDTHHLPHGGFYFAPGAIEGAAPPRPGAARRILAGLAQALALLAVSAAIGVAAGYIQARGLL
jgi:hypothetical protein